MVMMKIVEHINLKQFSTMRLGGNARYMIDVTSKHGIAEAVSWAKKRKLPILAIGQGSNIVFRDEGFAGLVILNRIKGIDLDITSDGGVVKAGGGEVWDEVVAQSVEAGLSGIECLSKIPGTVGAAPVQNIGAYGQELSDTLIELEAYDARAGEWVTFTTDECQFGYRSSRFNSTDKGRFIIATITLRLHKQLLKKPFYKDLNNYFIHDERTKIPVAEIREAIIKIRAKKLPDPAIVANNGSFFKIPIVSKAKAEALIQEYPDLPNWDYQGGVKLAAGWLIEQCGLKGWQDEETGMAVWHNQALVMVNEHAQSTDDLLKFRKKIIHAVSDKFGVTLEQEPELI
jgi:UDP-N-acetylmuramate dehydrogenase